jgi:hypothetical protein
MATPNEPNEQENAVMLISYRTLRTIVGILGMLLSAILVLGMFVLSDGDPVQRSISHFYHTRMGDVFVGLLTAISLFLFVYKGPEKKDHWMGNIAGILGLIVAFVPTGYDGDAAGVPGYILNRAPYNPEWTKAFHLYSAGIFLLVLAGFALWLFPKTYGDARVPRGTKKFKRNIIYYSTGIIMILCVIILAAGFKFFPDVLAESKLTFLLESVALMAFGISWLIKGEQVILKD